MSTDPELQTLFFLTLLLTPVMPRAHCPYLFQPSILHSCSIFPRLMPTTAQAGRDGVFLVSPLPLQQSATIHGSSGAVPFWKAIHRQTPARTGCAPDSCLQQNPVSGLGPSCPLPSPRLLREPSQRAFSTSAVQWQFSDSSYRPGCLWYKNLRSKPVKGSLDESLESSTLRFTFQTPLKAQFLWYSLQYFSCDEHMWH